MKKLKLLCLFFILIYNSFAQQTTNRELSDIEMFLENHGALVKREILELGKIETINIVIIKCKDLTNNVEKSAIRFSFMNKGNYKDIKIAFIDNDELDGIINSLKYLNENIYDAEYENHTELSFVTRSGIVFETYQTERLKKWETIIQLNKYENDTKVFMLPNDFNELLILLEKAKTMMQ